MRSKTIVSLVSAAGLLLALGLMVADAPVARAASTRQLPTYVPGPALSAAQRAVFLNSIQPKIGSGVVALKMARSLGLSRVHGKMINVDRKVKHGVRTDFETPVGTDYFGNENTPSIAASPIDERIVVAVSLTDASGSNACQVSVSYDGGITYGAAYDLPVAQANDLCAEPVVRTNPAPDAFGFVFSYLSVRDDASSADVVTAVADGLDPAILIAGPTTVVAGGADFPDKPWIAVHTFDNTFLTPPYLGQSSVYLTSTVFRSNGDCAIVFSKSTDYGFTWGAPATLNNSVGCPTAVPAPSPAGPPLDGVLQGSRPAAGPGTNVLVCYYDSGADGFNVDAVSGGKFNITCDSSKDRGATWSATHILASKDIANEVPRYLGPAPTGGSNQYHRIWTSMFPSVEIDHVGNAHVVFSADPSLLKTDAECGNVLYLKSIYPNGSVVGGSAPAYDKWAGKVIVGTAGTRFQGWATVVAQRTNTQAKPIVYVAYADHARGDVTKPNLVYDVKYRLSTLGGGGFKPAVLVTTQSSLSQYYTMGDYFDSSATQRRYHVVWTDRADKTDILDYECDVFARTY